MLTYRQLLRNLETMPESELDTCIRVVDFNYELERMRTIYIDAFAYNNDSEFVMRSDDAEANLPEGIVSGS